MKITRSSVYNNFHNRIKYSSKKMKISPSGTIILLSVLEKQATNCQIEFVYQLSLNIEKCSILVFDKKDRVKKIRD